jgi:ABC-type phosphate transport system substrate-binding protein
VSRQTGLRVIAATAACVASLGFAACGGDDDDSSDSSSDETTEETGATGASGSDTSADLEAMFRDAFEEAGLDEEQVNCAIEAMEAEIPAEDLVAAGEAAAESGGETPQEFLDAVQAAIADCQ